MMKYFFIISPALLLFISCTNDDMIFDIGRNKIDIKSNIVFVDTFTIKSYTVMQDSVKTSGLDVPGVLVGKYNDPEFGTISSSSFFRFNISQTTNLKYNIPHDAVFDSIHLFLNYNKYYMGDTLQPFKINVHRLKQAIKTSSEEFYNVDSISAFTEIFGQKSFKPKPHSSDTVFIKLNNVFGDELFNLMKKNDIKVTESIYFLEYLKGLMVTYGENNEAMLGFNFGGNYSNEKPFPTMRVYYHYITESKVTSAKYDFKAQALDQVYYKKRIQFNRISLTNRVVDFPDDQKNKLAASLTNKKTYIQGGTGILTRLEIPYLKDLFTMSNDYRILNAELFFKPVKNTYGTIDLPKNLRIHYTDIHNNILDEIYDKVGYSQVPQLQIDKLYQEETWYKFDVTNFVNYMLSKQTDEVPSLLISIAPEDLYKTVNRVVLGSQLNSRNTLKLKIYYMNIQ